MSSQPENNTSAGEGFRHTRAMILWRVLPVPFVVVILVCATLVYYFVGTLRRDVAAQNRAVADGHRRIIEQFLRERVADLQYITEINTFDTIRASGQIQTTLGRMHRHSVAFSDVGVFDERGRHVAYAGPYDLQGKNYYKSEWFRAISKKDVYISDVFMGVRNAPHFIIAVRKKDPGGRTWFLRATIDTQFFNNMVENLRIGRTGEAYLVNRTGLFQTQRRSGGQPLEKDLDFRIYKNHPDRITSFSAIDRQEKKHLYATGVLAETGWILVVRQELADAYAPLVRPMVIAVGFIVAGGGVVVAMAFFLAGGLANKLSIAAIEKKQMGTQLIMAGKLAEIGEMSAGVAHEINNPLQVMKSEYTMIKDILFDVEAEKAEISAENLALLKDSLSQIDIQIDRCKQITQGLLKFARKNDAVLQPVFIPTLMKEIVDMIEHRAHLENIRIVQEYPNALPDLVTDAGQLQQVFLNLINNAMHAIKEKGSGEIRITAVEENNHVCISVADDGCGIDPENLEKIFMPFFTTKPVGKGTGLGLSTSYGIVERLGGQIVVTSEKYVGSVFTVRLPIFAVRLPIKDKPAINFRRDS